MAPFRPLCGLQQIPVTAPEENGGLCFHSRTGMTPWVSLECNLEICVAPGEEHWLLDTSIDEVYWPCSHSRAIDRKSTRLNSSHQKISYAVFCLKKKKEQEGQLFIAKRVGINSSGESYRTES